MRLYHTREVIQDLDGIVLRDNPSVGTLSFDVVRLKNKSKALWSHNHCTYFATHVEPNLLMTRSLCIPSLMKVASTC